MTTQEQIAVGLALIIITVFFYQYVRIAYERLDRANVQIDILRKRIDEINKQFWELISTSPFSMSFIIEQERNLQKAISSYLKLKSSAKKIYLKYKDDPEIKEFHVFDELKEIFEINDSN